LLKVTFTIAAFVPPFYTFNFSYLNKNPHFQITFESFVSNSKPIIWVISVPPISVVKKEPEGSLVHCFFSYYSLAKRSLYKRYN